AGFLFRLGVDYNLVKQEIMREILITVSWADMLPVKMRWLYSWENYEEPVTMIHHYGIAYTDRSGFLHGEWTVALALKKQYDVTVHAGLEGLLFDVAAIRVGYSDG